MCTNIDTSIRENRRMFIHWGHFLENLGKWPLKFSEGLVVGARLSGEVTCQGVASTSPSYWKMPISFITF